MTLRKVGCAASPLQRLVCLKPLTADWGWMERLLYPCFRVSSPVASKTLLDTCVMNKALVARLCLKTDYGLIALQLSREDQTSTPTSHLLIDRFRHYLLLYSHHPNVVRTIFTFCSLDICKPFFLTTSLYPLGFLTTLSLFSKAFSSSSTSRLLPQQQATRLVRPLLAFPPLPTLKSPSIHQRRQSSASRSNSISISTHPTTSSNSTSARDKTLVDLALSSHVTLAPRENPYHPTPPCPLQSHIPDSPRPDPNSYRPKTTDQTEQKSFRERDTHFQGEYKKRFVPVFVSTFAFRYCFRRVRVPLIKRGKEGGNGSEQKDLVCDNEELASCVGEALHASTALVSALSRGKGQKLKQHAGTVDSQCRRSARHQERRYRDEAMHP
ncbi:uncharacterized protein UTRI_03025 [Ustilago trichophora]|uniref:Uncharacterized protein n=1 Tax=Ustilago trichophora TaxID=86804 RepID=A0A5C3E6E9_9BASI|nr:uncharacterized protein UTRI_03025 [Ustilago trichophora]